MRKYKYFLTCIAVLMLVLICICSCSDTEEAFDDNTESIIENETFPESNGNEFAKDNVAYYKDEWRR